MLQLSVATGSIVRRLSPDVLRLRDMTLLARSKEVNIPSVKSTDVYAVLKVTLPEISKVLGQIHRYYVVLKMTLPEISKVLGVRM